MEAGVFGRADAAASDNGGLRRFGLRVAFYTSFTWRIDSVDARFAETGMLRGVKNRFLVFAVFVTAVVLPPARSEAAEDAGRKAWQINVPLLELREASIDESVRALATKSRELDPAHTGVNFIWRGNPPADTRLNLRLANVPLYEASRYVARLAGARLEADQHALVFVPDHSRNAPSAGSRVSQAALTARELILPRVEFRQAALPEALAYLEKLARAVDPRKAGVNVVLDAPPQMREAKISLSLAKVPFGDALRYAAGLANLVVEEEPYALVVAVPKPKPSERKPAAPGE